jgi:hypothetical protein
VDALIGGGVGLLVTALLLPPNPMTVAQRAAEPLLDALADGFEAIAAALDIRDQKAAEAALERLRGTNAELATYNDALVASQEAVKLSPVWWRFRHRLARYAESAPELDRVTRNARVLARRAVALLRDHEPVPTELLAAVEALGTATRELGHALERGEEPVATRELVRCAVRHASEAHEATLGFSGQMAIGQIRFVATDLFRHGPHGRREGHQGGLRSAEGLTPGSERVVSWGGGSSGSRRPRRRRVAAPAGDGAAARRRS